MAKKLFLVDIDLNGNQLLNAVLQNLAIHPTSKPDGYTYFNTTSKSVWVKASTNPNSDGSGWLDLGISVTNLGNNTSPTGVTITSSTGTSTILPLADITNSGLLSPDDKVKLNKVIMTDTTDVSGASWVTADVTTNSTIKVPTASAVKAYVDNLLSSNDAMIFKGTLGTGGTITSLPTVYNTGWAYKIITTGTYAGVSCEVGDMIIAIVDRTTGGVNADWTVLQTNTDGIVTGAVSSVDGNIATFNGTTGKIIKDSGIAVTDIALKSTTITAGTGLTGGGDLSSNKTINVVSADDGITVNTDNIKLNIVNDLVTTSTTRAVSATQAKALQDTKAPLASPALTGVPTAPTAAVDTNTTQLATTAYVNGQGYQKISTLKYKFILATSATTYTILQTSHLKGVNPIVQVRENPTGQDVFVDISIAANGDVTINFNIAPAANAYVVIVQ